MKSEKISVVIPTYSPDIKMLKRGLFSLIHQSVKIDKVVVVENGVIDPEVKEVVEGFNFKYIFNEESGANRARNIGASVCGEGVLFFTDDDCELKHDCLENHLRIHNQGKFLVGGKVDLNYLSPKPDWLVSNFEDMLAKLDWTPKGVIGHIDLDITNNRSNYLVSANMSIRSSTFYENGEFSESDGYKGKKLLSPNDEMLLLENCRISEDTRIVFSSSCVVKHNIPEERTTEEFMYRRFYGQGVADAKLSVKSPHLKFIDPPVDPTDYDTIVTNTLLKQTVWSDYYFKLKDKVLTGDKITDREITRVYMMCYCQYISGVKDFLIDMVSTDGSL